MGKKQPGDEWNAGGDAKQEGMFLLGYKTRFSLVSVFMYVCINNKEHSVRPLLIIRHITELLSRTKSIMHRHLFRAWADGKNLGYKTRTGNYKDRKFLNTPVTFSFYLTVLAIHSVR